MGWRASGLRRMRLPGVDASVNGDTGSNADASAARPDSGIFTKAGPIGGKTVGTIASTLASVAVMLLVAGPLLAAEEAAPDPADTAAG